MAISDRKRRIRFRRRVRRRTVRLPRRSLALVQYLLELSMRMEKRKNPVLRLAGRWIGLLSVQYSEYIERRLFDRD